MVFQVYDILTQTSLKVIAAFVILLLGLVLGRVISKIIERILNELELNKKLKKKNINLSLEELISGIIRYGIYIAAVFFALNQIGLSFILLRTIIVIFTLLIIIFIILSIKDIIPNFISGLIIKSKSNIKINDNIQISNINGKIISITLLTTKIKTLDNNILVIPNFYLIRNKVVKK